MLAAGSPGGPASWSLLSYGCSLPSGPLSGEKQNSFLGLTGSLSLARSRRYPRLRTSSLLPVRLPQTSLSAWNVLPLANSFLSKIPLRHEQPWETPPSSCLSPHRVPQPSREVDQQPGLGSAVVPHCPPRNQWPQSTRLPTPERKPLMEKRVGCLCGPSPGALREGARVYYMTPQHCACVFFPLFPKCRVTSSADLFSHDPTQCPSRREALFPLFSENTWFVFSLFSESLVGPNQTGRASRQGFSLHAFSTPRSRL